MRSSSALYDLLAPTYDEHFAVPLRRAYDELAWDICAAVIPPPPAVVVDVGCGVGRWAQRVLTAGHRVIGIEPAPRMAEEAANRLHGWTGKEFTLLTRPSRTSSCQPGTVDVVLAIGSLQYTADPVATLRQTARWLRSGGMLCVLVDSLHALVIELLQRTGRERRVTGSRRAGATGASMAPRRICTCWTRPPCGRRWWAPVSRSFRSPACWSARAPMEGPSSPVGWRLTTSLHSRSSRRWLPSPPSPTWESSSS